MWRRMQRFWRIKLVLTACMLSALIIFGGRSLAQIRRASEQFDRDERRIERKVNALQKEQDDLKLSLESRLVRIETYMSLGLGLLGVLGAGVLGQWGMRLFDLLAQRRSAGK